MVYVPVKICALSAMSPCPGTPHLTFLIDALSSFVWVIDVSLILLVLSLAVYILIYGDLMDLVPLSLLYSGTSFLFKDRRIKNTQFIRNKGMTLILKLFAFHSTNILIREVSKIARKAEAITLYTLNTAGCSSDGPLALPGWCECPLALLGPGSTPCLDQAVKCQDADVLQE